MQWTKTVKAPLVDQSQTMSERNIIAVLVLIMLRNLNVELFIKVSVAEQQEFCLHVLCGFANYLFTLKWMGIYILQKHSR